MSPFKCAVMMDCWLSLKDCSGDIHISGRYDTYVDQILRDPISVQLEADLIYSVFMALIVFNIRHTVNSDHKSVTEKKESTMAQYAFGWAENEEDPTEKVPPRGPPLKRLNLAIDEFVLRTGNIPGRPCATPFPAPIATKITTGGVGKVVSTPS